MYVLNRKHSETCLWTKGMIGFQENVGYVTILRTLPRLSHTSRDTQISRRYKVAVDFESKDTLSTYTKIVTPLIYDL